MRNRTSFGCVLAVAAMVALVALAGCEGKKEPAKPNAKPAGQAAGKTTVGKTTMPATGVVYVCPMHPDVTSTDKNARCPKCGMALVPQASASTDMPVPATPATSAAPAAKTGSGTPATGPASVTPMQTTPPVAPGKEK